MSHLFVCLLKARFERKYEPHGSHSHYIFQPSHHFQTHTFISSVARPCDCIESSLPTGQPAFYGSSDKLGGLTPHYVLKSGKWR